MNARLIGLVSSASSTFGLGIVAGFRIHFAGTTYFSPSLSASLLTPWYVSRMPRMACGVLIAFDFFEFFALVCMFWGSAGAVELVVGLSTCGAEGMVALVLRCALVLRRDSTGMLTAAGREPRCWQCLGQKVSLSQFMSRMTPYFRIQGLSKINGYWPSFMIKKGASNLVWPYTVNVG